ncbi:MAG: YbaB/EbfC family nucleoid-associated protein [Leptospirillum sp.]|jgi:hypothetical protein|nr:YbaB/EbfC family nucleoid-associated protein [Nitrospiraceae bacterium]
MMPDFLKKAMEMKGKIGQVQEELQNARLLGIAGDADGIIVTMNGKSEVLSLTITPKLYQETAREDLERLLCQAINQAGEKARALMTKSMLEASGMPGGLPGFPGF